MVPTSQIAARIGVAVANLYSSINHLATGVIRMPPTDSPVEATDSATVRRTTYQRVTTVVTGTRPTPVKPKANNVYTA